MLENKIARFVGIEACKSIFSDRSTFVLRSADHYRRIWETTAGKNTKGDRDEGTARTVDGGTADFADFLASCWTILEGSEPTPEEWGIFKENEQNIVAIVTTPRLVYEFLNNAFQIDKRHTRRRFPFLDLRHRRVCHEEQHIDHTNIADVVPFAKNRRFEGQKEYRFVLTYACPPAIDSLIFCAGLDYMQRLDGNRLGNIANPEMSEPNKKKLREILLTATAGYGDFAGSKIPEIIANADALFS